MVCNWSPEPPRDIDDRLSMPIQVVVDGSDESEEEVLGNGPPGYELLPQGLSQEVSSEEEDQSDTEINTPAQVSASLPSDTPSTSEAQVASEVEEVDRLYSNSALRPQMTVDCEEVRAAMAGFSLPPSAYPPWAANIPESQWASALAQHIQRIQTNSSNS